MFIDDCKKIEGRLLYRSYFLNTPAECNVNIFIRKNETKVIIFQKHRHNGTSPTNCYEDLATSLYHQRLFHLDIKTIKWFLYYEEAKKVSYSEYEWQLCPKEMFNMVMDWEDGHFKDGAIFKRINEEHILNILEMAEYPSELIC